MCRKRVVSDAFHSCLETHITEPIFQISAVFKHYKRQCWIEQFTEIIPYCFLVYCFFPSGTVSFTCPQEISRLGSEAMSFVFILRCI